MIREFVKSCRTIKKNIQLGFMSINIFAVSYDKQWRNHQRGVREGTSQDAVPPLQLLTYNTKPKAYSTKRVICSLLATQKVILFILNDLYSDNRQWWTSHKAN